MPRIIRAVALASSERYFSVLTSIGATIVLSRLLTPSEFGIGVVGFAAAALAEGVREVSASNYIVQTRHLNRSALRTVFTLNGLFTLAIAACLYGLARPLARFYNLDELQTFLQVFALGFALGLTSGPAGALMARELAFGRRGAAGLLVTVINAGAAILFALQGASYMSFAWAYVISNGASAFIYPVLLRDWTMFGISLRDWRRVLTFGMYGAATRLLNIASENAAYLVMGRFVSPGGIGLLYRAGMVVTLPDRVLLGAVSSVAFPAFSREARDGVPLGPTYVRAAELMTAIYWPALTVIGLLAFPIILTLLGAQWREAATLVQIMAGAALFNAPMGISYTVPIALGAIRLTTLLALFQALVSVLCIAAAAPYGARAIAWSAWVSVPINVGAALFLVHRVAPFSVGELAMRLAGSAAVTFGTALGPLVVIAAAGWRFDLPPLASLCAILLAGLGWLASLAGVRHPLLGHIRNVLRHSRTRLTTG
ncbi:oligosaccharide flippase family protein [Chelatococcus reniformis]|uniref:Sugar transporter n=1 Tax=Chelatococcus reniformis TaxID=1494448 RepID=A0A916XKK2_9HYPH|nr:oligosaccharide flippase family protein [Chelatococcus reniformis]GGC78345.1 sugar transporter [Chelatococcus reniformis]